MSTPARTPTPTRRRSRRREYCAAVRFRDGHKGLFWVNNARDPMEARGMVFAELEDVAAVVVSERS